jgi:hypothetical protein
MLLLLSSLAWASPEPPCGRAAADDEIVIQVLTVGPSERLDRVFGHTAVYVRAPGRDLVYNYGMYEGLGFASIRDFLLGEQRYWLGSNPWSRTLAKARKEGRRMDAQELALPPAAASHFVSHLVQEDQDDRRYYNYHWQRANCTTRIRDALDQALGGALSAANQHPGPRHALAEGLRHVYRIKPVWLAFHYGTNGPTTAPLTAFEHAFMPDGLRTLLDDTTLDGQPLVAARCQVLSSDLPEALPEAPRWEPALVATGAAFTLGLLTLPRRAAAALLALWLLMVVPLGSLSAVLGAISKTEAYRGNTNLLASHPGLLALGLSARRLWRAEPGWDAATQLVAALALLLLPVSLFSAQEDLAWAFTLIPPLLAAVWRASRG